MSDLMTLCVESGGAEFSLQSDAMAVDPNCHELLLASVVGAGSQIQAVAAMLQSNVNCSLTHGGRYLRKFAGGYDCHKAKLGFGTWQMLAIAKRPGLLLDASDASLWQELRSDRFTTPLLKPWLLRLRAMLNTAELLKEPLQKGCHLCLLDVASEQLDEIVSAGVRKGVLEIA